MSRNVSLSWRDECARKFPSYCRTPALTRARSSHNGLRRQLRAFKGLPVADWFKVYETDLSNPRLQWAMSFNQQTAIVWFAILSQCCQRKSGCIPWDSNVDLLCVAQQLHIGPGIINEAVNLLTKIEFVSLTGQTLCVPSWQSLQSEYCQRKNKVSGHSRDKVELCRSRGEEIREDFSREDRLPVKLPPKKLRQP